MRCWFPEPPERSNGDGAIARRACVRQPGVRTSQSCQFFCMKIFFILSWSMKLFDSDSWMKSMVISGTFSFASAYMPSWKSKLSWIASMPSLDTWNIFWYFLIPGLKNMSHSSCWPSARHGKCWDLGNWNVMAIARDWQRFVSGFWDLPKAIQAPATEWCAEVSYARSTSCCCREP